MATVMSTDHEDEAKDLDQPRWSLINQEMMERFKVKQEEGMAFIVLDGEAETHQKQLQLLGWKALVNTDEAQARAEALTHQQALASELDFLKEAELHLREWYEQQAALELNEALDRAEYLLQEDRKRVWATELCKTEGHQLLVWQTEREALLQRECDVEARMRMLMAEEKECHARRAQELQLREQQLQEREERDRVVFQELERERLERTAADHSSILEDSILRVHQEGLAAAIWKETKERDRIEAEDSRQFDFLEDQQRREVLRLTAWQLEREELERSQRAMEDRLLHLRTDLEQWERRLNDRERSQEEQRQVEVQALEQELRRLAESDMQRNVQDRRQKEAEEISLLQQEETLERNRWDGEEQRSWEWMFEVQCREHNQLQTWHMEMLDIRQRERAMDKRMQDLKAEALQNADLRSQELKKWEDQLSEREMRAHAQQPRLQQDWWQR